MPIDMAEVVGMDKVLHFLAFAIGGAILVLALRESTRWSAKKVTAVAICALAVFGCVDEIHQLFTPGRTGGDLPDWIADFLGATVGAFTARFFYVRFRQNQTAAQTP